MDITQARAVVTGGASGLGNAVARHIAARGGQVTLVDIQEGRVRRPRRPSGRRRASCAAM